MCVCVCVCVCVREREREREREMGGGGVTSCSMKARLPKLSGLVAVTLTDI